MGATAEAKDGRPAVGPPTDREPRGGRSCAADAEAAAGEGVDTEAAAGGGVDAEAAAGGGADAATAKGRGVVAWAALGEEIGRLTVGATANRSMVGVTGEGEHVVRGG